MCQKQWYYFQVGAPHFRTYFSGWIGMFTGGYNLGFDPWPFEKMGRGHPQGGRDWHDEPVAGHSAGGKEDEQERARFARVAWFCGAGGWGEEVRALSLVFWTDELLLLVVFPSPLLVIYW